MIIIFSILPLPEPISKIKELLLSEFIKLSVQFQVNTRVFLKCPLLNHNFVEQIIFSFIILVILVILIILYL